ncbi:hypothetical protein B7P43_G18393 [Cryptotermes secundus]|uniref:Reverse transcriptase domain-containing protein n=1 Tax=Cryptotermes secundus TaxID=105785 RepID=A0A2J7PYB7_9NEOP|nr:hypothetical protein B7P43_G18393 [Cryptotermes secundus]
MDDLVVYSRSREEHLDHLREVFTRLQKAGFTLNQNKLHLAQREIQFLGHLLSAEEIRILPERVEAITSFPPPKNLKALLANPDTGVIVRKAHVSQLKRPSTGLDGVQKYDLLLLVLCCLRT